MDDILLVGAGGHAKSVIDSIEAEGKFNIVGFLDKDTQLQYKGYKTIGIDDDALKLFEHGIQNAFITIGFLGKSNLRMELYKRLKAIGYHFPNIIDPSAILANGIRIGEGNFIGKRAVLNADVAISSMNIINTGAIIEHDCKIGSNVHLSVGSIACGGVFIHDNTFIGANATIIQGIEIGQEVIVGAGAVVITKVEGNSTVAGVPAKKIHCVEEGAFYER